MIQMNIPGWGNIVLEHLVSDVNGTLVIDGILDETVAKAFTHLKDRLELHLVTGDMHGNLDQIVRALKVKSYCVPNGKEKEAKADYVRSLGRERVIAIGQGNNDAGMLKEAKIGICILSLEGLAVDSFLSANVLANNVLAAFDLLENPDRLIGTLRR